MSMSACKIMLSSKTMSAYKNMSAGKIMSSSKTMSAYKNMSAYVLIFSCTCSEDTKSACPKFCQAQGEPQFSWAEIAIKSHSDTKPGKYKTGNLVGN